MEDQLSTLEMYFQRCEVQYDEDDHNADDHLVEGEYWEFIDPDRVEAWSLFMIPFTNEMTLSYKFKGAQVYLQISFQTKIKEVEADSNFVIKIKCMMTLPIINKNDQYHFTLCIDLVVIPFNLSPFLKSLELTPYSSEIKELEKKLDNKWKNANGTPLTWKKLCNKIRHLFTHFHMLKGKLAMQAEINKPWTVSKGGTNPSRSHSSRPSVVQESGSSRGHRNSQTQADRTSKQKGKKDAAPPAQQTPLAMGSEVSEVAEGCYVDEMENVPHSQATDKKPDYERVSQVYKKFWTTCEDAYVLGIGDKKEIDISQLIVAPSTFYIRSKEATIVEDLVNWLLNIPDKSTKQTLCIMPVGCTEKPTNWDEIKGGNFYIINGQHIVEASKFMFDDANNVDKDERENFRKWNCFIVWSKDAEKLRCISAYYNRTNHFVAIQPSWATNILGARSVWEAMGRPENPTATKSVGITSNTRRTVENRRKKDNFQAFERAMLKRFSLIEVNKSLKISKTKAKEEKLKLTNELRLITAPDDIYKLWSEVISAAAHGELFNPDTDKNFNAREGWNPDNCMLNREFFKHLGNLSYDELSKLAKHLLNQRGKKRRHSSPKVTVKKISSVLDDCYTTQEWVKRRKRKNLVMKELHAIDPSLGLFNPRSEIINENWKKFKKERFFSSATMDVLLDRLGEAYFGQAKNTHAKNKTCSELFQDAFEFFKSFLKHKYKFKKPTAHGHYRPYDLSRNVHKEWPPQVWDADTSKRLALGIIDFRSLPGIEKKESSTIDNRYFVEVLSSMQKTKKPSLEDVLSWLFICGDEKEQAQVVHFVETNDVLKSFSSAFSIYSAGKHDRLGDVSASRTPKKVFLIFLQDPTNERQVVIPEEFNCPESARYMKVRAYIELEYQIHNTELRMEFYLWIVQKFVAPGMSIFSGYTGGKLTCAAML